jgi:hypothetical protein
MICYVQLDYFVSFSVDYIATLSSDSSVGIATGYGLNG